MKQALLIIDVQNDYFEHGKMPLYQPQQALAQINQLEKDFQTRQLPIIYVQHINASSTADFFHKGSYGAQLHQGLLLNNAAIIIEKQFPNSFYQTNLQETLADLHVQQLVITGMMTHMCVDSTTRASAELGYQSLVIADATATKAANFNDLNATAEQVQTAFLAALQTFAQVKSTADYLKKKQLNLLFTTQIQSLRHYPTSIYYFHQILIFLVGLKANLSVY